MHADSVTLLALNKLRRTLETPHTIAALSAEIAAFSRGYLQTDRAELVATTPADPKLPQIPGQLAIPLPDSPLTLRLERRNPFRPEEVALAELLASIITSQTYHLSQLSSAKDFQPDSIAPAQLQGIYNIMASAGTLRPLRPTLAEIHAQVNQICDASTFIVALVDPNQNQLTFPYAVIRHQITTIPSVPMDHPQSLAAWVVSHDWPFFTGDVATAEPPVSGMADENAPDSRSILWLPLRAGTEIVGALSVQSKQQSAITESTYQVLHALANHIAIVLKNAQLYSTMQTLVDKVVGEYLISSALRQSMSELNNSLSMDDAIEKLLAGLANVVPCDSASVGLLQGEQIDFLAHRRFKETEAEKAISLAEVNRQLSGNKLLREAIDRRQPIIINDVRHSKRWQTLAGFEYIRCWMVVPMLASSTVIGVITLDSASLNHFGDREAWLAQTLATQAGLAVHNARLYTDARERLHYMSAMVDVAQQVTGKLRLDSVMQTTVQLLKELFKARASTVALLSEEEDELEITAGTGIQAKFQRVRIPTGMGVSGRVVDSLQPVYIPDAHNEDDFLFFDEVVRSLLVVPLIHRGEILGTLTVDSDRPDAFTESDLQLMTIAAAQVSIAIAQARLFEQLENHAVVLTRAYIELKENDRLKDELVQNVSHELRTPLTFVRGYVDLLLEGDMGALTPAQAEALRIVSDKTGEITRLVEDIMSLQRIHTDNLNVEWFSLPDLLQYNIDIHQVSDGKDKIDFRLQALYRSGNILADRGRLNQVLDNLIGNAIKFSPDRPEITIRLLEREHDLLLAIADKGIGMPADKTERIFDRFYQADGTARRRFGGAGLGLAIVKRIIDAHGGEIWVHSEEGQGSTFYLLLPQKVDQGGESAAIAKMLVGNADYQSPTVIPTPEEHF